MKIALRLLLRMIIFGQVSSVGLKTFPLLNVVKVLLASLGFKSDDCIFQ